MRNAESTRTRMTANAQKLERKILRSNQAVTETDKTLPKETEPQEGSTNYQGSKPTSILSSSSLFSSDNVTKREIKSLEDLTLGEEKFKVSTGTFYEQEFNRFFRGFTLMDFDKCSGRDELLKRVSRKTGNSAHRVLSTTGDPIKVHFFGEVIDTAEYDYVVRSGLIFDPTLMPEGKTESVLRDEYLELLINLNHGVQLEIYELDKGEWVPVEVKR